MDQILFVCQQDEHHTDGLQVDRESCRYPETGRVPERSWGFLSDPMDSRLNVFYPSLLGILEIPYEPLSCTLGFAVIRVFQ